MVLNMTIVNPLLFIKLWNMGVYTYSIEHIIMTLSICTAGMVSNEEAHWKSDGPIF